MRLDPIFLLPLLVLTACGAREEGITLSVGATLEGGPTLQRTDGATIQLERGLLSFTQLELIPCEESATRRFLRALSPLSVAHAHGSANPLVLAAHRVLSLETPTVSFHEMTPPPGRYCKVRLAFSPSEDDTHGAPEDGSFAGRTLRLAGSFQAEGAATSEPFTIETRQTRTVEKELEPLELSASRRSAELTLTFPLALWFSDFTPHETAAADTALEAAANTILASTNSLGVE